VRDLDYDRDMRHGRFGDVGARTKTEIGMHAVRGRCRRRSHRHLCQHGRACGTTHKASSRDIFATGAVRAATWLMQQKPGLYDMQDVLG